MEVVNSCVKFLSNYEVGLLLSESKAQNNEKNLSTILYQTSKYVRQSPSNSHNKETITKLLLAMKEKGFNLTKCEKLQIVNHLPRRSVELQLLVEECIERLTEDQEDEFLQLINSICPLSQNDDNKTIVTTVPNDADT